MCVKCKQWKALAKACGQKISDLQQEICDLRWEICELSSNGSIDGATREMENRGWYKQGETK